MATESKTDYSEPEYAKVENRKAYPFYHVDIEHKIPPETRDLLEKYSHIPREQQSKHVHEIRDRAFDIRAYPCIGLGSWLVPQLCRQPVYPEILQRVKSGATLVDIGTFIGHDLRRLAVDGCPTDKLFGVDIINMFDVGYDFFQDRESFKAKFIEADFLGPNPELAKLKNQADIIVVSQVLHQWDWEHQAKAAEALASFTKPGSLIVGNEIGRLTAGHVKSGLFAVSTWKHNPDTCKQLWDEVGEAIGAKFETQAWMRTFAEMGWDPKDSSWMESDTRVMEFAIRRIN